MVRCGVNMPGLDQLEPFDGRIEAMIWSWAPGEPSRGRCSVQRVGESVPYGRWKSRRCAGTRPAACRKPNGRWKFTPRVAFRRAERRCDRKNSEFAVPRTGYEAQLLRVAMERTGRRGAWLGQHRRRGGAWVPLDLR